MKAKKADIMKYHDVGFFEWYTELEQYEFYLFHFFIKSFTKY